ncbi:hypothetical protein ACK1LH_14045 [Metabacillus indicus]|uniref:hypothetical protein n=1 Tax=Metabacillus indicus TaxID=246786 RepID=UPI003984190F
MKEKTPKKHCPYSSGDFLSGYWSGTGVYAFLIVQLQQPAPLSEQNRRKRQKAPFRVIPYVTVGAERVLPLFLLSSSISQLLCQNRNRRKRQKAPFRVIPYVTAGAKRVLPLFLLSSSISQLLCQNKIPEKVKTGLFR